MDAVEATASIFGRLRVTYERRRTATGAPGPNEHLSSQQRVCIMRDGPLRGPNLRLRATAAVKHRYLVLEFDEDCTGPT